MEYKLCMLYNKSLPKCKSKKNFAYNITNSYEVKPFEFRC